MCGNSSRLFAIAIGTVCLAVAMVSPRDAHAGRRPFFWTWDTEVMPERGVELETWYTERISRKPTDQTQVWAAPIVGLTDRLELALPLEWSYWQAKKFTQFDWYGAELRWRLNDPDRDVAGPLTGLVRFAVHRPVRQRDVLRIEANAVASYEPTVRCKVNLDGGLIAITNGQEIYYTYAGGASCKALGELRLGGEVFGEIVQESAVGVKKLTMVGPNLALTHGRFWLTAGILFGVTEFSPRAMSRLIWAISF